mmetsp:Transcript_5788/g.23760  ORF Transcript_5788/g.23760 Transcript_5788/m.23760 type:complete len:221 (-) Transcript_5788:90-752(-)
MYLSSSACLLMKPSGCFCSPLYTSSASSSFPFASSPKALCIWILPPIKEFGSVSSSAASHHWIESEYIPLAYALTAVLYSRIASSVAPRSLCAFSSSFTRTFSLYALCAGARASRDLTPSAKHSTSSPSRPFSIASAYSLVARSTVRLFAPKGTRSRVSSSVPSTTDRPPRMLSPKFSASFSSYCFFTKSSGESTGASASDSVGEVSPESPVARLGGKTH